MTKSEVNIKEVMAEKVERPNSHFSEHLSYTSMFLPPMYDIMLEPVLYRYFVNMYIDDAKLAHSYKRPLFILLQTHDLYDPDFRIFDSKFRKNRNFVYSYFVGFNENLYLQMYVFECPQDFEVDYDMFRQGMYSRFSDYLKKRFNKSVQLDDGQFEESIIWGVLHKSSIAKKRVEKIIGAKLTQEVEYFGVPTPQMEVFRYEPANQIRRYSPA